MRVLRDLPSSLLAVYAHPDDADVAAGGLLALCAERGAAVHVVVLCQGDKGVHPLGELSTSTLASVRSDELVKAARLLGATAECLEIPDGDVTNGPELRERLVAIVRGRQPEMVVGPDPTATFFGGVYVNHRDHRETGWALLDAVAPAAAMAAYFPNAGAPHQVAAMLLSGTHEPDVVIDVASVIDRKVDAVMAHHSQLGDDTSSVREVVRQRAEQTGRPLGLAFAESFRHVQFRD